MKRKLVLIIASIILCGSTVFAQTNHFTGYTGNYSGHLNTWIAIELDGVRLESTDIELGAFVDGEFRGTQHLAHWTGNDYDGYMACIQIFKDNAGDVISFKMYDHATETEYDDCPTTIVTQVAGEEMMASPQEPIVVGFTSPATPTPSGPEHPWDPASVFPSNMSIFAEIQINGEPISGDNWEVGAFCGDECRGDHVGFEPAPTSFGYMMTITVYGVEGDVLNFYLYDIENESIVGECSTTVTYVEHGNAGVVWDPLILNFVTLQTFTKEITGYTADTKDHYYLIASPIGQVDPTEVTNMLANDYDLYYFDQNPSDGLEWINYENGAYDLEPGKGYLYANSQTVTLTFTGTPYSGTGEVTLSKLSGDYAEFSGWNLVGNPFADTAYITKAYYTMGTNGAEVIAGTGNSVEPMEGIFVIADSDNETMTFSTEAPAKAGEQLIVNLSHNRGNVIDRAIVRFDEGGLLPKFMLNKNNTKLYIPQNGEEFALVRSANEGEMPVSFKAAENGTYTLNVSTENVEMSYLHLIDNMTGADVDLLVNPNYTFDAKMSDYSNRFKLVFAAGNTDDNFTFFSNGSWVINNEGQATLQIVDVNGRILCSEQINGCYSKSFEAAPGVYMFRLINGDNMKVQKIVVE